MGADALSMRRAAGRVFGLAEKVLSEIPGANARDRAPRRLE
jgi:hypothetical protein